jgi:putative peptide zinc metalloprotease protein
MISGMDDLPLIFDPVTGIYHRVSRSGELLLGHLDGNRTTEDLVGLLSGDSVRADDVRRQLDAFLSRLSESGLLVGSDLPEKRRRQGRIHTSLLMPRVIVTRSLPVILEPIARHLRNGPLRLMAALALTGAILGFAYGAYTLRSAGAPAMNKLGPAFLAASLCQLTLVLVHENAHALVAQIHKVPVRGLGFAMLFYCMPVAYVDRTDAYRLRGRGGRLAIALAGVTSDGWFCATTAVVVLNSTGFVHQCATILLAFQMMGLLVNVNLLLPSDGYTAVETATGLVDVRGRSFALVRCVVLRRPLPTHLANLSARVRAGYFAYGGACVLYIGVVVYFVIGTTISSVQTVARGLGT